MSTVLAGFLIGASLIIAIGPQNALIIRQGIKREAVVPVLAVCMVSDILLVFGGVAGVGALIERAPAVLTALKWGGAAYLAWFGLHCFRDAFKRQGEALTITEESDPEGHEAQIGLGSGEGKAVTTITKSSTVQKTRTTTSWKKPVLAALTFTWLNPTAYIDTLVMLGGMANQYGTDGRWLFAVGSLTASMMWFPLIGFGSMRFSHVLSRPKAWRIINVLIGCIMAYMCIRLMML